MFDHLMLVIYLSGIFSSSTTRAQETLRTGETTEIGKVINLPKTNLLEDFKESEASVFESFPLPCYRKETLNFSRSYFEYYESTKAFFSKLATQAGLDASLQSSYSLSISLSSVTQSTSSSASKVSGISLIVESLTEKIHLDKDCLYDENYKFKKSFMDKLETLPLKIDEPWERNSWRPYYDFLELYGSHVITSVTRGARINEMSFARSSRSYSQREFQVKSCVSLGGPTSAGTVDVSACANVSSTEASRTSDMSTTDKLFIRGGSRETRAMLLQRRSKELIEKLMNEAGDIHSSVQHTFKELWTVLQSRFPSGSPNYARGLNLKNFYLGFLNYGCPYIENGGVEIQKFDYTKRSSEMYPEFECTLAAEGCHSSNDCRYVPIYCSCRGPTCVHYEYKEQETGVPKVTAFPNTVRDWGWHGCDWKVHGSYCDCYNDSRNSRRVVWSLPSRDYVVHKPSKHGAHLKAKDRDQGQAKRKRKGL